MALTVKHLVNRHGAFVSAVTALLVGAAIVVHQFVQVLIGWGSVAVSTQGLYDLQALSLFPIARVLLVAIPFAVGFFISLWILAPIAEELRLPHVVTRAILATGVAATVVFIVLLITGFFGLLSWDGAIFGQSFPLTRFDGGRVVSTIVSSLTSAASVFVSNLPVGVLAGVFLWIWRKDHPPQHPLSGLVDEV